MAINLTTAFTLTNGTRLVFTKIHVDEDGQTIDYTVTLRSATGGTPPDSGISSRRLQIRATNADQVSRNGSPVSGGNHDDLLIFTPNAVSSATAFVDAVAAWKTSKAAFEAHCLTKGYVHSSLTGT